MRVLSWRLPPLFLLAILFLLFSSLALSDHSSSHPTSLDSRGFDGRQGSLFAAAEPVQHHEEGIEDYGAVAVREAMDILKKLKRDRRRTSRFTKPSGVLNTTAYYVRRLFTLLFLNGPPQSDVHATSPQSHKLSPLLSKAVELLNEAAEQDNPDAMYLLGEMNFYGNYTHHRNYSEAFRWYNELASLDGNSSAQHMVGFMYATGIGGAVDQDQAKAMLYHTFAAEAGNTRSQMTVAFRHHMGIAAPRNCDEAVHFYKQVADKAIKYMRSGPPGGHMPVSDAYRYTDEEGGVYGEGASVVSSGIRADHRQNWEARAAIEDVVELLDVQSRKGDVKSTLSLARLHYDGTRKLKRDFRTAKEYYLKVARKYWTKDGSIRNDGPPGIDKLASKAAGYLGRMFLRGEGMEQNFQKARIWFKRGIENGDALSQYSVGLMYLNGLGVPRDPFKAATYFAPAADQDLAAAQVRLGALFLDQGDITTATRYFDLAARNGHPEAIYYIAEISNQGLGRERSCGTAAVYYKMVAEKAEIIHSSFREANEAYEDGDLQTALVNNMMAAEQGYEVGQANVAYLLDKSYTPSFLSSLIPYTRRKITQLSDAALALIYWTRSAKQQNIDSLVKMGDYYLSGIGVGSSDHSKAATCYQAAAETMQSAQAMWNLGWMHENGIGIAQDFHLAKRFYDQSLETNKEAYLPVQLALLKLRLRSYWNSITHGGVNSIRPDPAPETKKRSFSEWVTAFLEADAAQNAEHWQRDGGGLFEDELGNGADDWDTSAVAGDGLFGGEEFEDVDDGLLETLVILALAASLAALVWYRQLRQVRGRQQGAAAEGQGQGQAQTQPQARQEGQRQEGGEGQPQGQQRQEGGEAPRGEEEEQVRDRGVFPAPGELEFRDWVAGGVGH